MDNNDKLSKEMETLLAELEEDFNFTDVNFKMRAMRLMSRKHYYVGILMRKKRDVMFAENERNAKINEAVEKLEENQIMRLDKSQTAKKVQTTTPIVELDKKIKEMKLIIELLEHAVKNFSEAGFLMKSVVEMQKMEEM